MPHVLVEFSDNLSDGVESRHADETALLGTVHDAVVRSGLSRATGVRTRATRYDLHRIGTGEAGQVFVAVTVSMAPGRTADVRRRLAEAIADAIDHHLGHRRKRAAVSVEVREIDDACRVNRNRLHVAAP